jgi:hypothetical protein
MRRLVGALFCVFAGGLVAFYGQPYVNQNSDIILIIVTVFTVFAGFLVAIIALIGDPSLIPEGSWRIAELGRDRIQRALIFNVILFVLYLTTIAFLFTGAIVERALCAHDPIRIWIERCYLFFGVTSFLFTFALPVALLRLQQARYDAETARRRREAGIQH